MVLLNNVIEVFALPDFNLCLCSQCPSVVESDRTLIWPTFVDVNQLWFAIVFYCLYQKRLSTHPLSALSQQEVDCITFFINCSIQILPFTFYLMYVSSSRHLLPTGFLRFLNYFSIKGENLNIHRCIVAWSTLTPLIDNNSSTSQ